LPNIALYWSAVAADAWPKARNPPTTTSADSKLTLRVFKTDLLLIASLAGGAPEAGFLSEVKSRA
jgi:hypothetical protein